MSPGRQIDQVLGLPARGHVSALIGKANDLVLGADVQPLRVGSLRIEGDAIRAFQPAGEDLHLFRLTVAAHATEYADFSRFAFGEEDVAIRRGSQQPRVLEPA